MIFFLLLFQTPVFAYENTDDPVNGNLIEEPTLSDYVAGYRSPGILSSPFDIITDATEETNDGE